MGLDRLRPFVTWLSAAASSMGCPKDVYPRPHSVLPFFELLFTVMRSPVVGVMVKTFLSTVGTSGEDGTRGADGAFGFVFFVCVLWIGEFERGWAEGRAVGGSAEV